MKTWHANIVGAALLMLALPAMAQAPGGIPGVLAPGVTPELVQEGFTFTEGPVGTADGQYGQLQAPLPAPDVLPDCLIDGPVGLEVAVQGFRVAGDRLDVVVHAEARDGDATGVHPAARVDPTLTAISRRARTAAPDWPGARPRPRRRPPRRERRVSSAF